MFKNKSKKELQTISELKEELQSIRKHSLLILTDYQTQADRKFRDNHYNSCSNGNRYLYEITGHGLGVCLEITCPVCGKSEDITDSSTW